MKIAGIYSFNGGVKAVETKYPKLLIEVKNCIEAIDASICKTKKSEEKTMTGDMLYSPVDLNEQFKKQLYPKFWQSVRVKCDYPTQFYTEGYLKARNSCLAIS